MVGVRIVGIVAHSPVSTTTLPRASVAGVLVVARGAIDSDHTVFYPSVAVGLGGGVAIPVGNRFPPIKVDVSEMCFFYVPLLRFFVVSFS